MSTPKKFVRSILAFVVLSALCLGAAEVALRGYHYFYPVFIFYDSSYVRFQGKPFAQYWGFKLNSRGFHDVEFNEKKHSTYRILGIGDSFTFGAVPYEHNYLTLLEAQLRANHLNVEVLNLGISGTGPREYLGLLLREGLALKPDMVLLSFFIGNDFVESQRRHSRRRWYTYSYVTTLVRYISVLKKQDNFEYVQRPYCDDCPVLDPATYLEIERARSSIYLGGGQNWEKLLADTMYYLKEIQNICRRSRIDLQLVILPDEIQVNPALRNEVRATLPHELQIKWNNTFPIDQLTAALKEAQIAYIDLYPEFSEKAKTRTLYKPRDTHWNIAGNQLAAGVIGSKIRAHLESAGRVTSSPG